MRTSTRSPRTIALAVGAGVITAAALLLGGCGSSDNSTPSTSESMPDMSNMPAVPSTTGDLTIHDFAFEVPSSVTPGQTLTIHNNDSTEHSVTSDAKDVFSVDVPAHGTVTMVVPDMGGSFAFHCKYHPSMHGTLTVS